jgi:hypothetical protein
VLANYCEMPLSSLPLKPAHMSSTPAAPSLSSVWVLPHSA